MDFTTIKTAKADQPESNHYALFIIDHFSRKIIYNKVFYLSKGKGSISGKKVIKALQECLYSRKVENNLLIHTDNGIEFTNRDYFNFVEKHKFLIGSTSVSGHPEHNAVVESAINNIKNNMSKHQIKGKPFQFPTTIKTTQQLQTLMDNRINFYNKVYTPAYNGGLTTTEKEQKYEISEIEKPVTALARKDLIKPYNSDYTTIKKYHNDLEKENYISDLPNKIIANQLQKQTQMLEKLGEMTLNNRFAQLLLFYTL